MKYYLFGGERYYAAGGMHDLIYVSDSIEKIWAFIKTIKEPTYEGSGWWHLYDMQQQKIIACSVLQPYNAPDFEELSTDDKDLQFYQIVDQKYQIQVKQPSPRYD